MNTAFSQRSSTHGNNAASPSEVHSDKTDFMLKTHLPTHRLVSLLATAVACMLTPGISNAAETTAAQQLDRWNSQASSPGNADRGKVLFNTRQGGEWSCDSCHGTPPTAQGKHASTGKVISPLAPAFNRNAFTDTTKIDKWFRRNCKDVLERECNAGEKADVLAYLLSLKP
jgi:hypothetical protein